MALFFFYTVCYVIHLFFFFCRGTFTDVHRGTLIQFVIFWV